MASESIEPSHPGAQAGKSHPGAQAGKSHPGAQAGKSHPGAQAGKSGKGAAPRAATSTDPAVLAEQIERTREDLAGTLDAIAEKVSPKKATRRTAKKAAEAAKETAASVTGTVKDKAAEARVVITEKAAEARVVVTEKAGVARDAVQERTGAVSRRSIAPAPVDSDLAHDPSGSFVAALAEPDLSQAELDHEGEARADSAGTTAALPPVAAVPVPSLATHELGAADPADGARLEVVPLAPSLSSPREGAAGAAAVPREAVAAGVALLLSVLLLVRRRRRSRARSHSFGRRR